ncbi:hypothetical protein [Acetilactobacillus jinshanensis]|uniref:Uncharacterized protein n=1 Tax=Acetilactobacillus jinshanensis TaxID=1720083 RepID=A0A4P6ZLC3_9LACO|nr:hypothetical protein [Acetilactobacillus jinshanensis]QBP18212.1 hypothetical protein ELX58_03470 [Acetilactobacillus jinshanensis]URL61082.1 hypothetical protein HGK75_03545 [uncultured bacterium]
MMSKRITIQDAINHSDDIDVCNALQQFSSHKTLTRSGLHTICDYSHAIKNHMNVSQLLKKAGLNQNHPVSLTKLIQTEIK